MKMGSSSRKHFLAIVSLSYIVLLVCGAMIYVVRIRRSNATEICPVSSETGENVTFLIHGTPPSCYAAGLQGPCGFLQVLHPMSQDSKYGVCTSYNNSEGEGTQDVDWISKIQLINSSTRGVFGIPSNACSSDTQYSYILKRCISTGSHMPNGLIG